MNASIEKFDLSLVAQSLQLDEADVKSLFNDGRALSWIATKWVRKKFGLEVVDVVLPPGKKEEQVLRDPVTGEYWKVRSLTDKVCFGVSGDFGKGRSFDSTMFLPLLMRFKYYVVVTGKSFPNLYYWKVPTHFLHTLWTTQKANGKDFKISHLNATISCDDFWKEIAACP